MFGQAPSNSPFTSPSPVTGGSTPFGQAFASPTSAPFGSLTPATTNTSFGFGTPAPAPAFGTPAPAPTSAFGSAPATSGFGSTFGSPAPAFGSSLPSSTPFGAAPAPAGGLFGAPAPAPAGGLFGAPAAAPVGLFGSSNASFGQAQPATSNFSFGAVPAPAPAGSLFGAPAPAAAFGSNNAFGSSMSSNFGTAAPSPATGLFGSTQQQRPGTADLAWNATTRTDGNSNISLQAISAMPAYESKSFEELRVEDYTAGNKGSQGQQSTGGVSFGVFGGSPAPAPAPAAGFGLFGSAPAPAAPFGAPTASTVSTFGAAVPTLGASTNAFGAPAPAPPPSIGFGFGSPAAAPATSSLFGAPAPAASSGGLFGAPAPAPAPGGLFGSAPASGGLFGAPAPAPATSSLFGAPASASSSLFGSTPAPAAGSLFGSQARSPATAGGLFGAPAPATGSLFGGAASAPSPGLFGAPAAAPLFGATAAAPGSLFGSTSPAPSTGLFGAQAPAPTSLFGGQPSIVPQTSLFGHAMSPAPTPTPNPSADALLAQQLAAIETQKKELALLEPWRAKPGSKLKTTPLSLSQECSVDDAYTSYMSTTSTIQHAPKVPIRIRPRGSKGATTYPINSPILSPDTYLRSSVKQLVIKRNSLGIKPKMKLLLTNGESNTENNQLHGEIPDQNQMIEASNPNTSNAVISASKQNEFLSPMLKSPSPQEYKQSSTTPTNVNCKAASLSYELYKQVVATQSPTETDPDIRDSNQGKSTSRLPKLTKDGYEVKPSLEQLAQMSEADLATVSNFEIKRKEFGRVAWEGAVDIRDIDLDNVVKIEDREVFVYDDDAIHGKKPNVGEKLNRPAVITLYNIFPSKKQEASSEVKAKFKKKVEKATIKMGAELDSYDPNTGTWSFRVHHFSRYGLLDDDGDDGDDEAIVQPTPLKDKNFNALALIPGDNADTLMLGDDHNSSNQRLSHLFAAFDDDETASSPDDSNSEMQIMTAADHAYRTMMLQATIYHTDDTTFESQPIKTNANKEVGGQYPKTNDDTEIEECVVYSNEYTLPKPIPPEARDLNFSKSLGICAKLANECGINPITSSNNDYGMRMGRTFRVGWTPRGSVVHPSCYSLTPLYSSLPISSPETDSHILSFLETHLKHAIKLPGFDGCHLFSLPKGLGAKGEIHTYKALCTALDDYINISKKLFFSTYNRQNDDSEIHMLPFRAFSLLSTLYGQEFNAGLKEGNSQQTLLTVDGTVDVGKGDYEVNSIRRMEGFKAWLREAMSTDVEIDVASSSNKGDTLKTIFSAFSGGQISRACTIAIENDYARLATLIANKDAGVHDMKCQKRSWQENDVMNINDGLMRIYTLLAGELKLEENLYHVALKNGITSLDWRRRLSMKLCNNGEEIGSIADLISAYDADVNAGLAPPPIPRYRSTSCFDPPQQCLLYRLLSTRSFGVRHDAVKPSLVTVISPDGYTSSCHDFSLAFHLAAIIQALGCCNSLSYEEEDRLILGFSTQLIDAGLWEWAVYITLCATADDPNSSISKESRTKQVVKRAKDLVLLHYTNSSKLSSKVLHAEKKREFLQNKLSIPNSWFEEALASRGAYEGQAITYVNHLIAGENFADATTAIAKLILPNALLLGGKDTHKLKLFLQSLENQMTDKVPLWNQPNGCKAVLDLLNFSYQVDKISKLSLLEQRSQSEQIAFLLNQSRELHSKIIVPTEEEARVKCSKEKGYVDFNQFIEVHSMSYSACFTEAVALLNRLHFKLISMQSNAFSNVDVHASNDPSMSQLAAYTTENIEKYVFDSLKDMPDMNSITRGLAAHHMMFA